MGQNANGTGNQSAKPRLFLVGEGESEIGHRYPQEMYRYKEGVLVQFLARVLIGASWGHQDELPFRVVDAVKWVDVRVHRSPDGRRTTYGALNLGPLFERRGRAALVAAGVKKADCLVILIDQEKTNLPDARKLLLDARKTYLAARSKAGRPASDFAPGLVVGVPRRCLETWLLVDSDARQAVLGSSKPRIFSKDPEERPAPRDLKNHLLAFCAASHLKVHEARRMLAAAAKPEKLKRRCRKSYAPFHEDIKRELGHTAKG